MYLRCLENYRTNIYTMSTLLYSRLKEERRKKMWKADIHTHLDSLTWKRSSGNKDLQTSDDFFRKWNSKVVDTTQVEDTPPVQIWCPSAPRSSVNLCPRSWRKTPRIKQLARHIRQPQPHVGDTRQSLTRHSPGTSDNLQPAATT